MRPNLALSLIVSLFLMLPATGETSQPTPEQLLGEFTAAAERYTEQWQQHTADQVESAKAPLVKRIAELEASTRPAPQPAPTPDTQPAVPAFHVSTQRLMAPQAVFVNCIALLEERGIYPRDVAIQWDFGDQDSRHNVAPGYSAAHLYEEPGTYTISLRVAAPNQAMLMLQGAVVVKPNSRPKVTLAEMQPGTHVVIPPGVHKIATLNVPEDCVVEGTPGQTVLMSSHAEQSKVAVYVGARSLIRGLTIDSVNDTATSRFKVPTLVKPSGHGAAVVGVEFGDAHSGVNANSKPRGLLVQDCKATREDIRGYFAWVEGQDVCLYGNDVGGSVDEHGIRAGEDYRGVTLYRNAIGRTRGGNITMQWGSFAWVEGNRCSASVNIGPLGDGDGTPAHRTVYAVVRGNDVRGSGIIFSHGLQHALATNNLVRRQGKSCYTVQGYAGTQTYTRTLRDGTVETYQIPYNRTVEYLAMERNTGDNGEATDGNFLTVGRGTVGLIVRGSLYVAPMLYPGSHRTAPMFVAADDLSGFSEISDNVWPTCPRRDGYAEGGVHYVWPRWSNSDGYKTEAEWEAYDQVGKDRYIDVLLTEDGNPLVPLLNAGAVRP